MNRRHVSLIVRIELRRRFRSILDNRRRLAVALIAGVFVLLPLGAGVVAAHFLGQGISRGSVDVPMGVVRGGAGAAIGLVAVIVAIRAVQTAAMPANADGLLTWAEHREVVTAVLLLETLVPLGLFGVPAVVASLAFGVGVGSLASIVTIVVAALAIVVVGAFSGMAIGFALRNAVARSEVLARYRTAIAILLFLAYFGAIASNESAAVLGPVIDALAATPLGWYGDLALLGAPVDVPPENAAGALALTALAVIALGLLSEHLAAMLWYETPVEPGATDETSGMGGDVRYVPPPMARVARKQWLRAWRSPIRLLYVAYPSFFLVAPISDAIQTGRVPPILPAIVVLYGAWATGSAFTLNVIGEEGNVLPVTLSTPVSGRSFVGGCCLAGLAIGLPLTAILAVGTALLAGLNLASLLVVVILAVALPAGAVGVASGVGVLLPRTETVRVTRGREAIVPSLFAFAIYSLVLVVAAAPGTITQVAPARSFVADASGLAPVTVLSAGAALTLVVVGIAAAASFRYATVAFDDYCP